MIAITATERPTSSARLTTSERSQALSACWNISLAASGSVPSRRMLVIGTAGAKGFPNSSGSSHGTTAHRTRMRPSATARLKRR